VYPKVYNEYDRMAMLMMNTIQTTDVFDNWYEKLKDRSASARIAMRIDRAQDDNFGDSESVGEGVSEMRIHYGPGYRVYYKLVGRHIVILLAGGDKSSQKQDIKTALALARQL
jgi:putative addiction module killer protein